MFETYYAGAYWGPRKESPEACARRAKAFFDALARCDSSLSRWYESAGSREEPLSRPLKLEINTLQEVFRQDVNRTDGDGSVIEELGFRLWSWNEEPDYDDARLSVHCGCYSPWVPNNCVLNLPHTGPNARRVLTGPVVTEVLRCMALAWEPDWGVAMSHDHRNLLPEDEDPEVLVGWVTYLSRRRGPVPPLPAPVRVESIADRGTLITLTSERFTASNPEHLALAGRVREALHGAGLLGPPA
jgi:Immunity protein 52